MLTSTSEVYGTARFVPITEEHPLQGQSPYSATKIAADQLAYSFFASFGLPVVIALNHFTHDTEAEIAVLRRRCAELGVALAVCRRAHVPSVPFHSQTSFCRDAAVAPPKSTTRARSGS